MQTGIVGLGHWNWPNPPCAAYLPESQSSSTLYCIMAQTRRIHKQRAKPVPTGPPKSKGFTEEERIALPTDRRHSQQSKRLERRDPLEAPKGHTEGRPPDS